MSDQTIQTAANTGHTEIQQSPNEQQDVSAVADDLLTLKQIAASLGVEYGRLRGFADAEGVRGYVGAVNQAGVKGVRYPASAEALFRNLINAQDEGLVTPRTARAWLSRLRAEPDQGSTTDAGALVPQMNGAGIAALQQSPNDRLVALLDRMVQVQEAQAAVPPEDRLIAADEAAQLLACSPRSVARYVRPVRRGAWRRSDILRYIARL